MKKLFIVLLLTTAVCASGQTIPSSSIRQPWTTQSINNVEDASLFTGSDIGAKINAAIAACPVTQSCKITLPPGHNYSFATMVTVTGTLPYLALDCQGSALTFTGTGDAMQVAIENENRGTGAISNCYFINGTGNTSSTNVVHQFSREAFEYHNDSFFMFNNAASVGIFLDNVAATAGYSERTVIDHVTTWQTTKGIRLLGSHGGTNSFSRTIITKGFCNAGDGQICLSIEGNGGFQSADVYDSYIDMRGNLDYTAGPAARAVSVTAGGDIRLSVMNLGFEGPSAAFLTYIDNYPSAIESVGFLDGNALSSFNGGTSDSLRVPNLNSSFVLQPPYFALGQQQARNPKLIWSNSAGVLRYGLVPEGAQGHGYFQIFKRQTTDVTDPEVDATPSTGNIQHNLLYCDVNGCGVGDGFGTSATTGGGKEPQHTLDIHGDEAVSNPAIGVDGTYWSRSLDGSGNGIDYFLGTSVNGQPSFHVTHKMKDYTTSTDVIGMTRWAGGGRIHYSYPFHTPSSSSEACTLGEISNDASFMYVCTATNAWKRAALTTW